MSEKAQINAKSDPQETKLVGIKTCINEVFPDAETRPGQRTFLAWREKRYFPYLKIGGRCFYDPVVVRKNLSKKFEIQAV